MPTRRESPKLSRITCGPPRSEDEPRGLDFHDERLGSGTISVIKTAGQFSGGRVEVEFRDLQPPQTITLTNMEWAATSRREHSPETPAIAIFLIREATRALAWK